MDNTSYMKRPYIYTLSLLLSLASLHASPQEVILRELTSNHFIDVIDSDLLSKDYGEEMVIKIEEGTKLPIKLKIASPILSIENIDSPPLLVVNKTFYIKIMSRLAGTGCFYYDVELDGDTPPHFLFSHDAEEWLSFEDFFEGSLNTAIIADEETHEPTASISVDMRFKQ